MILLKLITSSLRFVMFITSIRCLYFGTKNYKTLSIFKGFYYLTLFSLIDTLSYLILVIVKEDKPFFYEISSKTQLGFQLFEIFIITAFYIANTYHSKKVYGAIKNILISVLVTGYIIIIRSNYNPEILLTLIELLIINFFAIRFYLFYYDKNISDNKEIKYLTNGLFIFINITTPYYMIENKLQVNYPELIRYLNAINDLGYSILFILITKCFKCTAQK